ncbi:MAG: hypothetical protein COB04_14520 [Gammaproteobacteria bacterium]|nr:MAG: hypothetical protein COB04_14520 [Gammaproteobacteria bacterium]
MKYQLVLQFDGALMDDFDQLLKLEFELGLALGDAHGMDGHCLGAGKLNLLIRTDVPAQALAACKSILTQADMGLSLNAVVAAYKADDDDGYTVIFPEHQSVEFSLG